MKLRCKRPYANREMVYRAGDVFEASPGLWLFLQSDSPGTFELVEEVKEVAEPPQDKAVKRPARSKATRRRRSKTDESN
jgi:hypothetical protein